MQTHALNNHLSISEIYLKGIREKEINSFFCVDCLHITIKKNLRSNAK